MLALLLTVSTLTPGAGAPEQPQIAPPPRPVNPFAKWEKNIVAIEKRLSANPPKPGAIFFAGSSSIVQWDLKKSFPDASYINVGFGGSVIVDSTHFAPRILTPHKPGTIVFYAGDNDIARGNTPEQVFADFKAFVAVVRKDNPSCRILFIPVKPSLARWKLFDVQKKANSLVKNFCEKLDGLVYVDIVPLMLGSDGTPLPELFVKDGLHLTPKGYQLWNAEVRKALK
ncbi:MAG: GDSL-type esterase/lipase family protein [Planctomycetia bacterium]|nr:GDSL-type esterase/lipase family protein [Planctomycetia bacterium]